MSILNGAGNPVVRPEDLVALRIETVNMLVVRSVVGAAARLRKAANGTPAYLILHFPPQSFAEETFFQSAPGDFKPEPPVPPEPDEPPLPAFARARISGESRLVFVVPDNFDIEYSLASVLEACQKLPMEVTAAADGQTSGINGPCPKKPYSASGTIGIGKLKTNPETSIEMPWRLILSPRSSGRWRHAAEPDFSSETKHTELWHSRLVAPHDGKEIEPPYPDKERVVRAVWALQGEVREVPSEAASEAMQSNWPPSLPDASPTPYLTTLDNNDRYQIAHLSSNFRYKSVKSNYYVPNPIDTNMMMLSALGGWLDSRGAWDLTDADGLSVEEWVHRASMGRDHYVRVVYRGYLFPFGHRVSLVKISERKFHHDLNDNPAYLRQRIFIVVREKERVFSDPLFLETKANAGYSLARNFPFTRIELLTDKTPDLEPVGATGSDKSGIIDPDTNPKKPFYRLMFWPHVKIGGKTTPFLFQCAATDHEGRRVLFDLPMIFMDKTVASPAPDYDQTAPNYAQAAKNANIAIAEFKSRGVTYNTAKLNWQRVALAPSTKSGDTSALVSSMTFGGCADNNASMQRYSDKLSRPMWAPQMEIAAARIESIANLTGTQNPHEIKFSKTYLEYGLPKPGDASNSPVRANNKGEVFIDICSGPSIDFSSQGDKSGGFVQPNLAPKALSRLAGPVTCAADFAKGKVPAGGGFLDDAPGLMPLLFGCISLGELIEGTDDIVNCLERVPQFITEAGTKADSLFNDLARLSGFMGVFAAQSAGAAEAALTAFAATLNDLIEQARICSASQQRLVGDAVNPTLASLNSVIASLKTLKNALEINPNPAASGMQQRWDALLSTDANRSGSIAAAEKAVRNLIAMTAGVGASLPANLKQSISNAAQRLKTVLAQYKSLEALADAAYGLLVATKTFAANPEDVANLRSKIAEFRTELKKAEFLDGAPRNALLAVLDAIDAILGMANLLELLTGDELTIRFDWNPKIKNWPESKPIFRANDKRGLLVAVEAKVKKNGSTSPKVSVNCSLKNFDLVLVAPAEFIELNFEKIEFSVDSKAKTNVDVLLSDIKFVGVLSFVETLRDLIPLDGFSDPPYLDITKEGIDAGFSISLPTIAVGVLCISNISLGAGINVPFIGRHPLSVRFNFCTREKPFQLTVMGLGGGGFFGITINPSGVAILEAALEFGASVSVDLGVASGGVHIMAGIYFRIENSKASLTGYLRMGGNLNVLGLINASIELYLGLRYEFSSGKCVGEAKLTIGISVLFFSADVTISCERKFAGSNGDPTLRQMLGLNLDMTLEKELEHIGKETQYAWREYLEAFAEEDII